jgi:molybdopterin-biosynthesis enzyme MoeA-like protein
MASVEIVTIGTEILLGHLVDTNSVHIARTLADQCARTASPST